PAAASLPLHDALPISFEMRMRIDEARQHCRAAKIDCTGILRRASPRLGRSADKRDASVDAHDRLGARLRVVRGVDFTVGEEERRDRKSTRLNSSHRTI